MYVILLKTKSIYTLFFYRKNTKVETSRLGNPSYVKEIIFC